MKIKIIFFAEFMLSVQWAEFQSLVRELSSPCLMVQLKKKLSFRNVNEEIIDTLGWERFANVVEGIIRKINLIY